MLSQMIASTPTSIASAALLQEIGPPAGLPCVGQSAIPGDVRIGYGRAGVEQRNTVHPKAVILCFGVCAVDAVAEHVRSRQVSRNVNAVLMAAGDYLIQILAVLLLILDRPTAAP